MPEKTALSLTTLHLHCRLYSEHMGTKPLFIMKFYLQCIPDNDLKEALKIISFNSVKVRSVADTADFPVIRHVSDTKDTEYHAKLAGNHFTLFKQFGKGILKLIRLECF